uniref:Uncharacterized protein n=1 Tax=Oryza barthii TaxID=65489 RepID=A0A0D3FRC1_9ORYZ
MLLSNLKDLFDDSELDVSTVGVTDAGANGGGKVQSLLQDIKQVFDKMVSPTTAAQPPPKLWQSLSLVLGDHNPLKPWPPHQFSGRKFGKTEVLRSCE